MQSLEVITSGLFVISVSCSTTTRRYIMDKNTKDILNRPFDRAQIKDRVGPGGRMLSYVAIGDYIARLNEAFDGNWTYEITETKLLDEEVIVQELINLTCIRQPAIPVETVVRFRLSQMGRSLFFVQTVL